MTHRTPQSSDARRKDPWRFLREFPWEKCLIWGIFLLLLWVTNDFFDIWLFTFFISYTASGLVDWICSKFRLEKIWLRKSVIALVFALFICTIGGGARFLFPTLQKQAGGLISKVTDEHFKASLQRKLDDAIQKTVGKQEFQNIQATGINEVVFDFLWSGITEALTKERLTNYTEFLKKVIKVALHFLLSMIFSFIIVWDIPRLQEKVTALGEGGLHRFYEEIGPGLVTFCRLLGRAFQAQFFIAICNTALTGLGLLALGMNKALAPLILIVFLCSFIPVLGVVISSVPIAITALVDGDVLLMFKVILLILVVHSIEAYIINPRIFGDMLHMHPLIVLVILLVGEHFFGVWGLLLGIPLTNFVYMYFITKKKERLTGVFQKPEG